MASQQRRSRKQFRTPLLAPPADVAGALPPRRSARCPELPVLSQRLGFGTARRGGLLHTGESPPPPVAGGLFRRRVVCCPQPEPPRGLAQRRPLTGLGQTDLPV